MDKPGWKSTEFWMTVVSQLGLVVAALNGIIPKETATIATVTLNSVYTIMRTLNKKPSITSLVNK